VYDQVIESIEGRDSQTAPVHVINIEIQDNHEEATIGAFLICELLAMVNSILFIFFSRNKIFCFSFFSFPAVMT